MKKTKAAEPETAEVLKTKILLFDVETSPNIGYCWGKFEQNIIAFIKQRQIICFSWQWLHEKKVHVLGLPDFPGYAHDRDDNRKLILALHELVSKADVIVGHNIDGFDDKRANTDFLKHGLMPPPPHKTIDTLKVARAKFDFNSNRLGDLGQFLGLGKKIRHWGFELWERCLSGDPKAWALMKKYNKGDVRLLKKIYLKERPWMTGHPDVNAKDGMSRCPVCKSDHVIRSGWVIVSGGRKMRFHCMDCGKWSSGMFMPRNGAWKFKA